MTAMQKVSAFIAGEPVYIRLTSEPGSNYPAGLVLDSAGNVIGSADSYVYGGYAFAVHTPEFAGYTPMSQVRFVPSESICEVSA